MDLEAIKAQIADWQQAYTGIASRRHQGIALALLAALDGTGDAQRPAACGTCNDTEFIPCLAHVAGDGCEDLRFTCPDCQRPAEETS